MITRMSGTDPLILIIENELPTRRLLCAALASQGYRLAEAAAGREGLAQTATYALPSSSTSGTSAG